jgi:TPP-dependent pyruvate/acetoin dehydrogenase alpha subunit
MAGKNTVKAESGENPLVPNARLREMYTTMLEARTLEEAVAKLSRNASRIRRAASIRGQEAVRASVVLQLVDSDLVSDVEISAGMGSILGTDAKLLLKSFTSAKAKRPAISRLLPAIPETEQRIQMALGAALALKTQGKQGVVVAYLRKDDLRKAAYPRILKTAAANELPVVFIVLPRSGRAKPGDGVATVARISGKAGVPGIPVDTCDSVALYRVTQESLGRARGGDGPVLIECLQWKRSKAKGAPIPEDPIEHLRQFLLGRKISTEAWFRKTTSTATRRLRGGRKASYTG